MIITSLHSSTLNDAKTADVKENVSIGCNCETKPFESSEFSTSERQEKKTGQKSSHQKFSGQNLNRKKFAFLVENCHIDLL